MGRREALELARRIVRSGDIETSQHLLSRADERNVTHQDIEHCISRGRIARDAEWNERFREWRYRIEGEDVEGVELILIVTFDSEESLVVITTF